VSTTSEPSTTAPPLICPHTPAPAARAAPQCHRQPGAGPGLYRPAPATWLRRSLVRLQPPQRARRPQPIAEAIALLPHGRHQRRAGRNQLLLLCHEMLSHPAARASAMAEAPGLRSARTSGSASMPISAATTAVMVTLPNKARSRSRQPIRARPISGPASAPSWPWSLPGLAWQASQDPAAPAQTYKLRAKLN
jgi:hypothetical protein